MFALRRSLPRASTSRLPPIATPTLLPPAPLSRTFRTRSPLPYSVGRAHALGRRTVHVFAQPPKEEPEEPLEGDAVIDLTPSAMAQIARAQGKAGNDMLALRVSVESGGCHGYQYKMEVTDLVEESDYLFLPPDSPARLLIDASSLGLLSGSRIDYATELIGSSFRITDNPHASDKGGCGCGVSWELKE